MFVWPFKNCICPTETGAEWNCSTGPLRTVFAPQKPVQNGTVVLTVSFSIVVISISSVIIIIVVIITITTTTITTLISRTSNVIITICDSN